MKKMERRCGVTFFFAEIRVLREIEFENSWGRLIAPFTVLLFPFFFFLFFLISRIISFVLLRNDFTERERERNKTFDPD